MSTFKGNDGVVSITGTAIAELKAWTFDENADQIDDTAMGDTYKTSKSGMPSATGTIECHYDPSDSTQEALVPGTEVALILYPNGTAQGSQRISLTAQITGRTRSGAIDAIMPRTFNFSLSTGTVTFDVVP